MTVLALAGAAVLLVANAFFVGAEFALIAARRTRMEQLADEGVTRARVALASMRELSLMLSAAQLGITMASLGLGFLAEPSVAQLLDGPLHAVGLSDSAAHSTAVVIALVIVVFVHMVVGEMVPKNIAIAEPERTALALAVPIRAFVAVFRPVVHLLNLAANAGVRLVGVEPTGELVTAHTAAEIARMVHASRRAGLLDELEHELLSGALVFPERTVATAMVPLARVVSVPATASPARVEEVAVESGHSRIPVWSASPADIRGFVHAKDLLDVDPAARHRPLPGRLVRRMLVVRSDDILQEVLLAMRRARLHFALVTDEHGATAGIVTIDDVLSELVGEISSG